MHTPQRTLAMLAACPAGRTRCKEKGIQGGTTDTVIQEEEERDRGRILEEQNKLKRDECEI